MARVLLHFRDGYLYAHCAEQGVEVVCVDEAAPGDRIYEYIAPHAPSGRFDPDERDLGECSTCHGEGLVYLPGVRRSKWDVFALQDHFDEAFAALAPAPDQGSSGNPAEAAANK